MPLKDRWRKWKEQEEEKHNSLMIWETEEEIGICRRKLTTEKDGNDSLWIQDKEEIHIFRKSIDLLISNNYYC